MYGNALLATPTLSLPSRKQRCSPTIFGPGFTVANAIANPFPGDPTNGIELGSTILGTPQFPHTVFGCGPIRAGSGFIVSELLCAIAQRPTLVLVSLGSNDALQAISLGIQPTNPQQFAVQYATFLAALASTGAKIVVTNIVDISAIPFLVPVPFYPIACPGSPLPAGARAADFIVANLAAPLSADYLSPCKNPAVRSGALVQQAKDAVTVYNRTIALVAAAVGATVVDVNSLMNQINQNGYPLSNGKVLTTAFGGGLFSLDGMHPTNTAYAIMANATIARMNQRLQTSIHLVDVNVVAANDPLVPH